MRVLLAASFALATACDSTPVEQVSEPKAILPAEPNPAALSIVFGPAHLQSGVGSTTPRVTIETTGPGHIADGVKALERQIRLLGPDGMDLAGKVEVGPTSDNHGRWTAALAYVPSSPLKVGWHRLVVTGVSEKFSVRFAEHLGGQWIAAFNPGSDPRVRRLEFCPKGSATTARLAFSELTVGGESALELGGRVCELASTPPATGSPAFYYNCPTKVDGSALLRTVGFRSVVGEPVKPAAGQLKEIDPSSPGCRAFSSNLF